MNLALTLPDCPICKGKVVAYTLVPSGTSEPVREHLVFRCDAHYTREATRDFKDPFNNYGPWSTWKCMEQCTKATEIALKLLEQKP